MTNLDYLSGFLRLIFIHGMHSLEITLGIESLDGKYWWFM